MNSGTLRLNEEEADVLAVALRLNEEEADVLAVIADCPTQKRRTKLRLIAKIQTLKDQLNRNPNEKRRTPREL